MITTQRNGTLLTIKYSPLLQPVLGLGKIFYKKYLK